MTKFMNLFLVAICIFVTNLQANLINPNFNLGYTLGVSAETNNRQLHEDEEKWLDENVGKFKNSQNLVFANYLDGSELPNFQQFFTATPEQFYEDKDFNPNNPAALIDVTLETLFGIGGIGRGIVGKVGVRTVGGNINKTSIITKNGIEITNFTKHGLERAINRNVKPDSILDALKNPLKIKDVKVDILGRQSQRFIGKEAEVVVNPNNGKIISVNPTSSSKARALLNGEK